MDDASGVRGFEGLSRLARNANRLVPRERTTADAIGERRPLDELHHEGQEAAVFLARRRSARCADG